MNQQKIYKDITGWTWQEITWEEIEERQIYLKVWLEEYTPDGQWNLSSEQVEVRDIRNRILYSWTQRKQFHTNKRMFIPA